MPWARAFNACEKVHNLRPLAPLLYWQWGVLALLCGLVSLNLGSGFLAFACLCLVFTCGDAPRSLRLLYRLLGLILGFALGLGLAWFSQPENPNIPTWVNPQAKVRIQARVAEVSGLPDQRWRILLENVQEADSPPSAEAPASRTRLSQSLPGRVAWTWDKPVGPRPLPGQYVSLTTKLRPNRGFDNIGSANSEQYWAARDVWLTAWTLEDKGQVNISGSPSTAARWRENLRLRLENALLALSPPAHDSLENPLQAPLEYPSSNPALSQALALAPALLFGDRFWLQSHTIDLFTSANLVHSLALSGQHLALAALGAAFLVGLAGRMRPLVFLRMPRRKLLAVCSVPLILLYLWLGHAPASLVRAAIMVGVSLILFWRNKPFTLLDTIFMTTLCLIAFWPQAIFDLGVQLSLLSVSGIALALPLLNHIPGTGWKRAALLLLGTSVAVQLATLPVLVESFGRISPWFPLNVLWLPVLGFVVLPLTALGFLTLFLPGAEPVAALLFQVASWPTEALLQLLQFLNDSSFFHTSSLLFTVQCLKPTPTSVLGYALVVLALVSLLGRTPKRRCTALVVLACLLLPSGTLARLYENTLMRLNSSVHVRVLDVGQGQSILLEWPDGRLLIDGGGSTSPRFDPGRDVVAHVLTRNRPPRLNALVASHADTDHTKGLISLAESFSVQEIWVSPQQAAQNSLPDVPVTEKNTDEWEATHYNSAAQLEAMRHTRGIPLRVIQRGDRVVLNPELGLCLLAVHPPDKGRFSTNNASLVFLLQRHSPGQAPQNLALLCGDAQRSALKHVLAYAEEKNISLRSEALLIPHHGSSTSLVQPFYEAVQPRFALISYSIYNSFGFPKPDVVEALTQLDAHVLGTGQYGEIQLRWTHAQPRATLYTARSPNPGQLSPSPLFAPSLPHPLNAP